MLSEVARQHIKGLAGLTRGLWPRHSDSSKDGDSVDNILKVHFESKETAYLGGQLVAETVRGIQGAGVITSVKHYITLRTNKNQTAIQVEISLSPDSIPRHR
ncbi:hypothetical protein G7Y89_g8541 [Cudoniella acicularis]|uniref:Uncharacterized protein n=1 Tax=Cudoniella acicularis TaxID=354080 RepID=A0A8H4W0Z9_9HELO|nr:hypothetical protein G7Y89_g8541 [Cudoniella acicularis]